LNGSSIGGLGDQPGRWLSSYFYIGRGYWNVTTDTFHGVIDDYVFYRYELTSTQIGNLYSSYP
ncbi:MAG: hypothetical protein JXR73_19985, partial [Candidatus Omnitrophica bacterium]|nr:hypothetical protein [Candidatus Omnitrophota bacterium]